jgi:hypothetical protein
MFLVHAHGPTRGPGRRLSEFVPCCKTFPKLAQTREPLTESKAARNFGDAQFPRRVQIKCGSKSTRRASPWTLSEALVVFMASNHASTPFTSFYY